MLRSFANLFLVTALAIGPAAGVAGEESNRASTVTEWTEIAPWQMFTMAVPPGIEFHARQGIDSWMGELQGAGLDISIEYGFRNQIGWLQSAAGARSETIQIDGYKAILVWGAGSFPAAPYFASIYIAIPDDHSCHTDLCLYSELGLILRSQASRKEDEELLLRMYKSIHFINARRYLR